MRWLLGSGKVEVCAAPLRDSDWGGEGMSLGLRQVLSARGFAAISQDG